MPSLSKHIDHGAVRVATVWVIRRASLAHREALIELCKTVAGPDDYRIEIMDDMIPHRVWLVASEVGAAAD